MGWRPARKLLLPARSKSIPLHGMRSCRDLCFMPFGPGGWRTRSRTCSFFPNVPCLSNVCTLERWWWQRSFGGWSQELIKQVYTACNTRDAKRLAECEKQLKKLRVSGKIGTSQWDAFRKSLDLAKNGTWEEAQNQALKFARDQIR